MSLYPNWIGFCNTNTDININKPVSILGANIPFITNFITNIAYNKIDINKILSNIYDVKYFSTLYYKKIPIQLNKLFFEKEIIIKKEVQEINNISYTNTKKTNTSIQNIDDISYY